MLIIIRKATAGRFQRFNDARRAAVADAMATARVRRPSLEAFFLTNEFASLPQTPESDLRATLVLPEPLRSERLRAMVDAGEAWAVPADSLGRTQRADNSTAESIRLWIKKNLAGNVDSNALAVVVAND